MPAQRRHNGVHIWPNGRVRCRRTIRIDLPAITVWGQLRDFRRFASHDFFHARFDIDGNVPRTGATLKILHRYGPFRLTCVGRILKWTEGQGYAFSDLSHRGPRCGFPHIFSYRVIPRDATACDLLICVCGRWTARFIPRPLAWLWLKWVFGEITGNVRNDFLAFAIVRKNHGSYASADQSDTGHRALVR